MLEASEQRVATLRRRLAELGDSLVVVGGGGVYNVHLHTDHAGQSVEAALEAGRPRDISITALAGAAPSCIGGGAREVRVGEQACATVAMAAGDGLVRTLRSLGAIVVEEERPSVRALVAAIQSAPSLEVLVLPNGENSLVAARLAAEQVRPGTGPLDQRRVERTNKTVVVLETPSIPAGIAAATAFNPALRLEDNRSTMWAAAARCRSGEVRRADRDETTAAGAVSAGGWVGLAEGEVVHTSHSCPETVAAVIDRLAGSDSEIVTLFPGAGTRDEEVAVAEMAAQRYTRLEVQIVEGGQPAPRFLIGVE